MGTYDDVAAHRSCRMNSEVYRTLLCAQIHPNTSVQLDNEPKHTAEANHEFLSGMSFSTRSPSPDLKAETLKRAPTEGGSNSLEE